jgi:ABC-type nitrate/sulfonate/bicarbonate transport system substrate-binding protein
MWHAFRFRERTTKPQGEIMFRRTFLFLSIALAAIVLTSPHAIAQGAKPKIKLGFAKCAHCLSMALVPQLTDKVDIEAINFNSGNDVLTALISKSIDVAQVTYLHFVTALDKDFDVVAISGQVNGGSELMMANGINLAEGDWPGLKKLIGEYKAQGKPFRVAASRGNAQDIHMRGELLLKGIDPNKDIQFINIPNPSDHVAALQRGEIEMICTVEPFAAQIRAAKAGKRFALPYDQAAGTLTNLIVTRSDVIKSRPADVRETVAAVVKLVDKLKADKSGWVDSINKYTGLDKTIAAEALKNAFPDYTMHYKATLAIALMMKDLKYVSRDVSPDIAKFMDYSFLVDVTKKPKNQLGF